MRYPLLAGLAAIALSTAALAQAVPDQTLTPGEVASTDVTEVCGYSGGLSYSRNHRKTPEALKDQITAEYHGDRHVDHEIDHRLPLALGGADTKANLWYQPAPDYHCKDALEVRIWRFVCHPPMPGSLMSLADGQAVFLGDWREGYARYVGDLSACMRAQNQHYKRFDR